MPNTALRLTAGPLSIAALSAIFAAAPAFAANLSSSNSSTQTTANSSSTDFSLNDQDGNAGLGSSTSSSGPITSSASNAATLDYGYLTGSAMSEVVSTATGNNRIQNGSASALTQLQANDKLTITSATLAAGTAVSFDFVLMLDSTIASAGQNDSGNSPSAYASVLLSENGNFLNNFGLQNFSFPGFIDPVNGLQVTTVTVNTTVGSVLDLSFGLTLNAGSNYVQNGDGNTGASSSAVARFASLGIYATSNDFGFTAESGASYAQPVPEPETYGMLLAGLGLVGFAARRRLSRV